MQKIASLTSLRFFAALMVFLHHLQFMTFTGGETAQAIYHYLFEGHAGVTFFYVLSGYIISTAYDERIQKPGAWQEFMAFRIARIYPTHLLMLPVGFLIYGGTFAEIAANLTLTQSMVPGMTFAFSVNPVAWSISNEMIFYVIFCLLAGISTRHLAVLLAIVLTISIYTANASDHTVPAQQWLVYVNPMGRSGDFLTGMMLARIGAILAPSITPRRASVIEAASVLLLALFILMAASGVPMAISPLFRFDVYYLVPMAAIVLAFSFNRGRLSKALAARWLVFLGEVSFAFYMVHYIVMNRIMVPTIATYSSMTQIVFYSAIMLLLSVALASVIHLFFERPVNRYLRARWKQAKPI